MLVIGGLSAALLQLVSHHVGDVIAVQGPLDVDADLLLVAVTLNVLYKTKTRMSKLQKLSEKRGMVCLHCHSVSSWRLKVGYFRCTRLSRS